MVPAHTIHSAWQALEWSGTTPELTQRVTHPVAFPGVPESAGLYRITLVDDEWWGTHATVRFHVKASKRIADPWLNTAGWGCPVLLTIGRTTRMQTRLQQHFGVNPFNNRLMRRLQILFPKLSAQQIREKCISGLRMEVSKCVDWRERFLLERYGIAISRPLLDYDAEH